MVTALLTLTPTTTPENIPPQDRTEQQELSVAQKRLKTQILNPRELTICRIQSEVITHPEDQEPDR